MSRPACSEVDYILFLLGAPRTVTCTEAARCLGGDIATSASHDAYTRLLARQALDTESLWVEAKTLVKMNGDALVLDDSTLDKPYAREIELVTYHWSGKHHDVVRGINLLTLLWTDGDAKIPCDFRLYDKPIGGQTKNEHFRRMLDVAKERGFSPEMVIFDSWYASLENLKHIRGLGWSWFTRLASNRLVTPTLGQKASIQTIDIPEGGRRVHVQGYGFVRVFRTVDADGEVQHWATSHITMTEAQRAMWGQHGWAIEVYHRGIKQHCNVERCQARREDVQTGHILLSLRAFLRLEAHRLRTGVSWMSVKLQIIRGAVRDFVKNPFIPARLATA